MGIKIKDIFIYIIQFVLAIISSIAFSIIFPTHAWVCLISIASYLEKLGYKIQLVGNPSSIDPGAVIVAGFYLLITIVFSILIFWKTRFKIFAVVFGTVSIFKIYFVFAIVSSIIWF